MTYRQLVLEAPSSCSVCNHFLGAGALVFFSESSQSIVCRDCRRRSEAIGNVADASTADTKNAPFSGQAGHSANREFLRRHHLREAKIERTFGPVAGVVKFLFDDPQSTRAWAKGSTGERKLAESLTRRVGDRAVLLHDRRIPRSRANIDHIAISGTGVWIIDTKTYKGVVERRDVGGLFRTDHRLYVGGRDQTRRVDAMGTQVAAVASALDEVGFAAPLHPVLCFVDAEWRLFARPFTIHGVLVTWGKDLATRIAGEAVIAEDLVVSLSQALASRLPPA